MPIIIQLHERERERRGDTEKAYGVGWMHSTRKGERESIGSSQMAKSPAAHALTSGRGRLVKC